jgi:hypothetical protein
MDSDNDDMTDDENDDPVAAHDEMGDLAFILVLCWAKPKTEASLLHQLNGTGNHTPYRPVFHNLFLTTSRHWGFRRHF